MPNGMRKRSCFPEAEKVSESSEDDMVGQTINVDFEGFKADDGDFHGIKNLLQQTFRGLDVNLSGLADTIISQNYVGSVIKQASDEEDEEDDEDTMNTDAENEVFGVTTILNLTSRKEEPSIAGLRTALVEKCDAHANDATTQIVRELLGHEGKHVGLLISERLVNLPPEFSLPVFHCLSEEIKEANDKGMPYDFSHIVMVCKIHKVKESKKHKVPDNEHLLWSNPEEELFSEESIASFEFSVEGEIAVSGVWDESDVPYTPWRKVILLNASKLPKIITTFEEELNKVSSSG